MGEQSAVDILKVLISAYPEAVDKLVGEGFMSRLVGSTNGKFAINLAEENSMSFRFCKALLSPGHEQRSGLPRVTALQRACVHESSLNMIKSLVEDDHGLLLMRDGSGHSVLHTAAKYASLDVVKYLVGEIEGGLTVPDKFGGLPLHSACSEGKFGVAKYLIEEKGCDLTLPDNAGELPLHKACRHGGVDLVQYLMTTNTASIAVKNHRFELPIHILCDKSGKDKNLLQSTEYARAVYRMLNLYPNPTVLQLACVCKCSLKMIRTIVRHNPELPGLIDDDGQLALHSAAEHSSLDVFKYLLHQNRDVLALPNYSGDLLMPDNCGELPLHKACRAGRFDIVGYLITKNAASVTVMNHRNELPIHVLCSESGKSDDLLQSVEYTEAIFKMLLAYPDPVIVNT